MPAVPAVRYLDSTGAEVPRRQFHPTDYRWRKQYGGLNTSDAKRIKALEKENARLKRLVADLSLDNAILKDVYDFVEDRLTNGKKLRWLNIIDEYRRECLASIPKRSWRRLDVIEALSGLFLQRGCPVYLRSDNGSEFTAKKLQA